MRKKLFAVIMSVMMMVTFMPAMAFAAGHDASHDITAQVIGWAADYSTANVEICCKGCKGAKIASTTAKTTRTFEETKGYIKVEVSENDVKTAVSKRMTALELGYNNLEVLEPEAEAGVLDGTDLKTIYYDFTGAALAKGGEVIEDMTADQYLDLRNSTVYDGYYQIKFTQPDYTSGYDKNDIKAGYVNLNIAKKDVKHDRPTVTASNEAAKGDVENPYNFGYFYMYLLKMVKNSSNVVVITADANPDVRVDSELPEYTPYTDGVTLNIPLAFRAYSHIEPVHVIGLSTDKTQSIKINTTDGLKLNHQIISAKSEKPLPVAVCDTEKEALRAGMYDLMHTPNTPATYYNPNNIIYKTYTGEGQNIEVATQNVSIEYGTIDNLGNVSYSSTAPEVLNVKTEQDGYYHDKDYHFIVKISKGSKTVYMPILVEMEAANVTFEFAATELYAGVGEKITVKNLVKTTFNTKSTYAADKANLNAYRDKYVTLAGVDTSRKQKVQVKASVTKYDSTNAETKKAMLEEFGEQFLANFNFNANSAASLYVTDANNDITAKGIWKKSYKAKNGKLPSKKTFKLKAKTVYGNVTFHKQNGVAKIKVASNGKVTVKKGLKKGTYKVKVKMTAPCAKLTKKVTVKVK